MNLIKKFKQPSTVKLLFNLYPPYIGAGIKIPYISDDWYELKSTMKFRWYNRNAVGTQFGGSLYSMIDPHIMMMLSNILGQKYYVWDQSAHIKYVKATKEDVTCTIKISEEDIQIIHDKISNGEKYLHDFHLEIRDHSNLIAQITKTIYIKKKPNK
jgi:acyl-coenzyme A thioesterase PaaI-like protein